VEISPKDRRQARENPQRSKNQEVTDMTRRDTTSFTVTVSLPTYMMKIGFWQPPRLQQLSLLAYSIDGRLPSVVFFSTTIHSQFQNEPQNCLGMAME
jgi:hypothetical protein